AEPRSDIPLILEHFDVQERKFKVAVEGTLEALKTGAPGKPVFSPLLLEWFQDAWLLGSVEYNAPEVRSGHMFAALLSRSGRYATGEMARVLSGIKRDTLREEQTSIVAGSIEEPVTRDEVVKGAPGESPAAPAGSALARFTINFTQQARSGLIDPVFGRDTEIRQMIDILARRRKNNPIVVGDPGVGKTAVVEGLALRIAQDDVPELLHGVELLSLDMGLLQAGAGVRGEFENRLKGVIQEVKESPIPLVLFIDEAHTMIGAGGAAGGGDAANLLKPALARGELRTIAATTWGEYKKYFERDAALARRFQLVSLDEPSEETAVVMLRGLRDSYEQTHNVHIQDAAVVSAVELSSRYISGRLLPDKAVSLLDTTAARVRIGQTAVPAALEGFRRGAQQVRRELEANTRDLDHGVPDVEDRRAELEAEVARLEGEAEKTEERWAKERASVAEVVALRRELLGEEAPDLEEADGESGEGEAPAEGEDTDVAAEEAVAPRPPGEIRKDLKKALAALAKIQGEEALIHPDVGPEAVASVVSDWTGIPVGRMVKDEAEAVLQFEESMMARIKGQDHALKVIGERIRQSKAGLQDPDQPNGVFLLVGPSGVGKTETALGLADLLYGGERSIVTINMSEFQEKHTVSRLIGSPPGYVGYGEGGELTEAVRKRPYSVVLLDECEKAHKDVLNLFYQVFDKGTLTDGEGREINFRNTMILLTSNLATAQITAVLEKGFPEDHETLVSEIRPILSAHFKPALLARMGVVPYYPLPPDVIRKITDLKLRKVSRRLESSHGVTMTWDDSVGDTIASRCTEVETGARNVDHIIRGTLMPQLSEEVLGRIGGEGLPEKIHVVFEEGRFSMATPPAASKGKKKGKKK
ncbi:MAG: type VI secretion system ATPase TssH, partial [Myxococcota bacterium]|nr:type VI secretion system ATPase TssH [Myxococcota bacterium]